MGPVIKVPSSKLGQIPSFAPPKVAVSNVNGHIPHPPLYHHKYLIAHQKMSLKQYVVVGWSGLWYWYHILWYISSDTNEMTTPSCINFLWLSTNMGTWNAVIDVELRVNKVYPVSSVVSNTHYTFSLFCTTVDPPLSEQHWQRPTEKVFR